MAGVSNVGRETKKVSLISIYAVDSWNEGEVSAITSPLTV